jgi:hypothetical protein
MRYDCRVARLIVAGLFVCVAATLLMSSYSRSKTAAAMAALVPTNDEGAITGEITYVGSSPGRLKIDTSADPVCSLKNPNLVLENNVVRRGKLANVFVYIKDGTTTEGKKLSDLSFDVPTTDVVLDQNGCRFVPRVLGIQANQKLKITNSDPTYHNVHPTPRNNPEWNQTQVNGAPPILKSFARAEVLIPVKCNQHPWMRAYVGVLPNPFYAVSKLDGSFTINFVPPGTYTLVAWHEGGVNGTEETIEVTVNPKSTTSANFKFGGATTSNRHSLKVIPAIELPMLERR